MVEEIKKARGLQAVQVNFTGVKDKTLGEVFGTEPIAVTSVNKLMWALIREHNLRVAKP